MATYRNVRCNRNDYDQVSIHVVRNGYAVRLNDGASMVSETFVFEHFQSLVDWLEERLITPPETEA